MIEKLRGWIETLIKQAFREGFEAGYLETLNADYDANEMTFTIYRDAACDSAFVRSKARQDAKR